MIVELTGAPVGVIVDEANEVLSINALTESPPQGAGDADYLEAVAKLEGRLLVILDLERPLAGSAIRSSAGECRGGRWAPPAQQLGAPHRAPRGGQEVGRHGVRPGFGAPTAGAVPG